MVFSKHLQQCIGLTLAAIATGLAIRYRNRILNYFRQNQRNKFDYDTWVIYSGPQSLKWVNTTLLPKIENERVAIGTVDDIPGMLKSDNTLRLAEKSEQVIIVLSPENIGNRWLRYQLDVALQRDPGKISVYSLEPTDRFGNHHLQITYLNPATANQINQIIEIPEIRSEFEYDFWLVYSGPQSQNWILDHLLPRAELEWDKKVAIDLSCYIPGKAEVVNIAETANKSKKVVIVLGPETSPNEFLRYEIEHALMNGPQNVLICQLEPAKIAGATPAFKCLEPLKEIQIKQAKLHEGLLELKQFLDTN